MKIQFFVPGIPAPQGSKRHVGNGIMIESSKKLKPWRDLIGLVASQNFEKPLKEPISVYIRFEFPRPKSHFGTGKKADVLREGAPFAKVSAPDVDKLCRAVLDGLASIAFENDAQVWNLSAQKTYGDRPGAAIDIEWEDSDEQN